ncbi:MAG: type I-C CRISPR-associated endonuclease Cas1c [Pirellulales bacterium]|nr:type I-C CRISPR-associated endonuclease Cas1c [Pirellulales bacterium]
MKQHLNTLFVTTQGAYLKKDGEAVAVRIDKKTALRVPLNNLGSIVCFGRISCSTPLLGACAERGVAVSLMTEYGRFLAAVNGFTPGNVLLRREQYRRADDLDASANIARACVIGKLANYRTVLRRAAREHRQPQVVEALTRAAGRIDQGLQELARETSLDRVRGMEGENSATYFGVFDHLIGDPAGQFRFSGRNRRPPLDPVNALLSFLYSMLANDARAACEAAGLDAAVGFLHRDRPGRPSLALDLMEELRPVLADRLVLSLINRQQVKAKDFTTSESGAVVMNDKARKTVLAAYQKRKQETLRHPFLDETITLGLLVHIQARLLARLLRGDLDAYPPFVWK